jgi:DNA-binding LacI/PurR family transcriptional regulator
VNPTQSQPPRRPTIRDVARKAGVSKSLVSMVIRGEEKVSATSREAVLRAAAELGYRPNLMARSLVQRRTRIVGVMVSDLSNPFFGDVVSGIQQKAAELGYRVLFTTGDRQHEREMEAIENLLELWVDGLILAGPRIDQESIGRIGRSVPVVVLHRPTSEPSSDSVTNDDRAGGQIAVDHCHSLGHVRIAHIDGGTGAGAQERREGYEQAMHRLGLEENITLVPGGFTEPRGYHGAQELLSKRPLPTALFAANDLCAIGAINAFEEAGLGIPSDISVIGYDNTSLAALRHVSLTSIHQPSAEMGQMAVDRLFERIDKGRTEPRHEVVPPSLVIRNTTGPPPAEPHLETRA